MHCWAKSHGPMLAVLTTTSDPSPLPPPFPSSCPRGDLCCRYLADASHAHLYLMGGVRVRASSGAVGPIVVANVKAMSSGNGDGLFVQAWNGGLVRDICALLMCNNACWKPDMPLRSRASDLHSLFPRDGLVPCFSPKVSMDLSLWACYQTLTCSSCGTDWLHRHCWH